MTLRKTVRLMAGMTALLAAAALGACEVEQAPPFEIEGTGVLEGRVFFDADGNRLYDPAAGDEPLAGVTLLVRERGTQRTFAGAQRTTDAQGRYRFDNLPPGTHEIFVDAATLPEGVVCVNPIPASVYRNEARFLPINVLEACLVRIQEAKLAPLGEVVNVRGVVTVRPGQHRTQADDMYIQDASGAVKIFSALIAGWGVQVGDTIDVTAERSQFASGGTVNEIQLVNPRLNTRIPGTAPEPRVVTTLYASTQGTPTAPDAGRLVQIRAARLTGPFAAGGGRNAPFNDGSGAVEVRIDPGVIATAAEINPRFTVNACYNVIGSLTPFANAAQIKPRSMDDIQEVPCN